MPVRRGSGYRVGEACVLTAGHVVAGPVSSVRVRFDADLPGEWSAGAVGSPANFDDVFAAVGREAAEAVGEQAAARRLQRPVESAQIPSQGLISTVSAVVLTMNGADRKVLIMPKPPPVFPAVG